MKNCALPDVARALVALVAISVVLVLLYPWPGTDNGIDIIRGPLLLVAHRHAADRIPGIAVTCASVALVFPIGMRANRITLILAVAGVGLWMATSVWLSMLAAA